jgi:hypothetical protein
MFIMIFISSAARRSKTNYCFGDYSLSFQILLRLSNPAAGQGVAFRLRGQPEKIG